MKKSSSLLLVIYAMTLSVKAEIAKPIIILTTNVEIKRVGDKVLFIESYEKDSTCNDVLSQNGCTMYHLRPPSKVKAFTVEYNIPNDIMLQAYNIYKERPLTKRLMPVYDEVFNKNTFGSWYESRNDYYTLRQIVIDEKGENMSFRSFSVTRKHADIFTWLLFIVIMLFGYVVGTAYYNENDFDYKNVLILGIITFVIQIVFFLGFNSTKEAACEFIPFIIGVVCFLVGWIIIGNLYDPVLKLIGCLALSLINLAASWVSYVYLFNNTFIPKLLICTFIVTVVISFTVTVWDKKDNWWANFLRYKLFAFEKEFWKTIMKS